MFRTSGDRPKHAFLLLLVILALLPIGDLCAQNYWDAIFELGYEPVTQKVNDALACRRIEDIHRLRERITHNLAANHDLLIKLRDLDARITSLDVANVYDFLPYSDSDGVWRGFGVRGQSDFKVFRLNAVDPNIEKWLTSSTSNYKETAGNPDHLGDIGLGIFIRPIRKDIFKFYSEARLYLGDIPAANLIRVVSGMLATTWNYAADAGNPQVGVAKEKAPNRESVKILNGISNDFPDLFRIISKYCNIENIVSLNTNDAGNSSEFNIRVRLNREALSKQYPELGKLLKKYREIVKFEARIFDKQGKLMGTLKLDSTNNLFAVQFRILGERILPLYANRGSDVIKGFNLTGRDSTTFKVVCDLQLNIVGMQLKIDTLQAVLEYRHNQGGPRIEARLFQTPKKIKASGSVYGIFPVWMVDIMIPSNVETIMNSFFSNSGNGQ